MLEILLFGLFVLLIVVVMFLFNVIEFEDFEKKFKRFVFGWLLVLFFVLVDFWCFMVLVLLLLKEVFCFKDNFFFCDL